MTEPPSPFLRYPFDLLVWFGCLVCGSSRHCYESQSASCKAICICVARLDSYCRQLFNSSTLVIARKLDSSAATRQLDRPRQLLDAQAHGVSLDKPRQARQELDRNSTGSTGKASTAPRQRLELPRQRLDGASTARQLDSQGSSWIPGWIVAIQVNHATKSTYPYSSYRAG